MLGLDEVPGRPLLQSLEEHVSRRRLLLILDNCEQLIDTCADLAHRLLRAASSLAILATSREVLRVPGEQVYRVSQMDVPSSPSDPKAVAACDAVQLFCDRARLADPGFVLTDDRVPIVAEIASGLDGIPLAIELAAARMRTMSLTEINAGLRDRFRLLSGNRRGVETRQRTLQGLVDWSYELLSDAERIVLARASVFAGGFDLAAATAVCGVDPIEADDCPST